MTSNLAPPGRAEPVSAGRVLVLAPHPDDEAIGCGGLLSQLSTRGARIKVLFLSDGSGGTEGLPEENSTATEYSQLRRDEASIACRVLGVEEIEHLDLPDGSLAGHRDSLAEHFRVALQRFRPDLVLVPSPLEVSPDHRAVFAALHDVLAPLRSGDPLLEVAANLRVLAYEINHPGYPDLLVDVSDRIDILTEALRAYSSQQKRHDYLGAALGLRRYRTHSLAADVTAAEGYRQLGLSDFTTRGVEQLVRSMGGVPDRLEVESPPSVSIVVRTRDRPDLLGQALASLEATAYPELQVVVVNDGGKSPQLGNSRAFALEQIELAKNQGRAGAANAGIAACTGEWVGFLDDDDLVYPEHLAVLASAASAPGVRVVYSDAAVGIYRLGVSEEASGGGWQCVERRLPYSRDFDPQLLLLDNYIPFNTLLIERELLEEVGPVDEAFSFFEDWDLLIRLASLTDFHHLPCVTCEYRFFESSGHHVLGNRQDDQETRRVKALILDKHRQRISSQEIASTVSRLRREAVALGEQVNELREAQTAQLRAREEYVAALQGSNDDVRSQLHEQATQRAVMAQRFFDLEARYHQLNGSVVDLRREREKALRDQTDTAVTVQRLYDQEALMREQVSSRDLRLVELEKSSAELGRTYQEIERLNALVREMEGTRAWRLHRWLERRVRRRR